MTQPIGSNSVKTLHSKLKTPRRQGIVQRKRLIREFDDFHEKKLATITAGAGYGKTTLVMDLLERNGMVPAWYRMDVQDRDFSVFISYLYTIVQHHFPGSCTKNEKLYIPKPGVKKNTDLLLDWLAFAERATTRQTALVFDDYHLVQDSSAVNQAMDFILERLPEKMRMIIIGFKDLPVKLSRLRVQEMLVEISETDLSFTHHEIELFFRQTLLVDKKQLDDIAIGTGGWAAGLVLLRYALNKKGPQSISKDLKKLKQAPVYIFSYLKENIFDTQPDHIKDFMMKAALLTEIDTRLCRRIFDIDNADTMLKKMVSDHLMIFPVDEKGTVFTLHHLMQEFLISRIKELYSPRDIYRLHLKIAKAVEPTDVFLALTHYIEGHSFDNAVRLIETHEMKFLYLGKINFLGRCLAKIPEQVIEKNPKLLLAQAKMLSHFGGDHRKTRDLIIRAHLLFKKLNAKDNMISCLVELGSHYYYTGHVKEAKLLMEQVLEDVDPVSITYVIAMTYLTFLSAVLGEFETARSYHHTAMDVIDQYPEYERQAGTALINTSLTHTLYFKGDFESSFRLCKKLLKIVLKLNIDPCLPLVYYQLAADCHALSEFKAGCDFAKKGIAACEKMALSDSRKAWVYLAWAQNCVGLEQPDAAKDLIEKSMALFEEPGNRWGMANAWECLHQVYLLKKNVPKAHQVLNSALEIINGYGLVVTRGLLTNSLAALLISQKRYDRAAGMLSDMRPRLKQAKFHLFGNHLLTARALAGINRFQEAADHLDAALSLSQRQDFSQFVKKEKSWIRTLFSDHPETFASCYEKHKTIIDPEMETGVDIPVLEISLLGPFNAVIGKNRKQVEPFKSAKALMLFKYLAAHRQRGFIHKDALIELLWPDQDPKKTGSRFNMAMSALRKTLEPDLLPKAASSYIERKKDTYRLYNDKRIAIDAERFTRAAKKALNTSFESPKIFDLLLAAESLYTGPFLEDDRYEVFCIEKRLLVSSFFGQLLNAIADKFENIGDLKNAILYTQKSITLDPCDETAFGRLMKLYSHAGDQLKVTRTYQEYQESVKQLDLPVNPKMTDFYQDLIQTR